MKRERDDQPENPARRTFLRAMLQELPVLYGTIKGGQGLRLIDLLDLPDHQMARIRPVVNPDYAIAVKDNAVWAQYRHKQEMPIRLFGTDEEARLQAFNLFNGEHTLGEIGRQLAQTRGEDETAMFACAKELFLALVRHMVCIPRDPLKLPEE